MRRIIDRDEGSSDSQRQDFFPLRILVRKWEMVSIITGFRWRLSNLKELQLYSSRKGTGLELKIKMHFII